MKSKKSRIYSSGMMAALNHPMRVTLFDLIRESSQGNKINEGITTPEMAEILNENRINLYHHLTILEKVGLIESFFHGNRMKKFRVTLNPQKQKLEKIKFDKQDKVNPDVITKTQTMIITPPTKDAKKFRDKVKELIKLSHGSWDNEMNILQVHIHWQWKNITQFKQKQMKEIHKKHLQRK